jgi:hypothetical protein
MLFPGRKSLSRGKTRRDSFMNQLIAPSFTPSGPVSPMVLSDRLIVLAEAADRAGFTDTAERLITLACSVFDESPSDKH